MSFQAYLDAIEERTGRTPRELVEQAKERGYDDPAVKAGVILEWLQVDYGLGRGHGMALVHVGYLVLLAAATCLLSIRTFRRRLDR